MKGVLPDHCRKTSKTLIYGNKEMEPKQWMNVPLAQLSTQLGGKVFIRWVIGRDTYAP